MKNKIINNIFLFAITFLVVLKSEAQSTTLVWPGDVNYDGVIDNMDVALLHLYLGFTGPARDIVHQNIFFQGHSAQDWGVQQENGQDIKHFDCNGDGVISIEDQNAIVLNWGYTHPIDPVISNFSDVWPGDINNDGIVNNMDISSQYMYIGEQGTPRSQAGILWQAYPATAWGITQANGADIVHHDCDGNGAINTQDHNAIIVNRDSTHTEGVFNPAGLVSASLTDTEHQIYLQPTGNVQSNVLIMDVVLENINHLDLNVFRGFFTVNYNNIDTNITSLISNSNLLFLNSWLGNPTTNLLTDDKDFTNQNVIEVAFTRTDNMEAMGKGIIGQLEFTINSIPINETVMKFEVNGIGIYDLDNNRIDIEDQEIYVNIGATTCESSLTISDISPFQNLYQSNGTIQTDDNLIVGQNQQVVYNANRVTLNEGFSVKAGADFKVRSSGCD